MKTLPSWILAALSPALALALLACAPAGGNTQPYNSSENGPRGTVTPTPAHAATPAASTAAAQVTLAPGSVRHPLYGVTIESVEDDLGNLTPITDALKDLHYRPTVRIVFNKWESSEEKKGEDTKAYQTAAEAIRKHGHVMGGLLDSEALKQCDVKCYEERARRYAAALPEVDIWEVGNEVNGNWARRDSGSRDPQVIDQASKEVGEKIRKAFDVARGAGKLTALTLYYNDDKAGGRCWEREQDRMIDWARTYVPKELKGGEGLSYVLISYYDDEGHCRDNDTGKPLVPNWQRDFRELADEFPHAKIGFGERGTKCARGETPAQCLARKLAYIDGAYRTWVDHPNYVGGFFWWYFKEDMVPADGAPWRALNDAMKAGPPPRD